MKIKMFIAINQTFINKSCDDISKACTLWRFLTKNGHQLWPKMFYFESQDDGLFINNYFTRKTVAHGKKKKLTLNEFVELLQSLVVRKQRIFIFILNGADKKIDNSSSVITLPKAEDIIIKTMREESISLADRICHKDYNTAARKKTLGLDKS